MPWPGSGGGDSGIKVLRCFRVLRPLRTVKRFPSLRILTSALIHSLSMLGDICVITFFVELGYVALNETARELEQPFGLDANDHTLTQWQRDFNEKLVGLIDLAEPELGYDAKAEDEERSSIEPMHEPCTY